MHHSIYIYMKPCTKILQQFKKLVVSPLKFGWLFLHLRWCKYQAGSRDPGNPGLVHHVGTFRPGNGRTALPCCSHDDSTFFKVNPAKQSDINILHIQYTYIYDTLILQFPIWNQGVDHYLIYVLVFGAWFQMHRELEDEGMLKFPRPSRMEIKGVPIQTVFFPQSVDVFGVWEKRMLLSCSYFFLFVSLSLRR